MVSAPRWKRVLAILVVSVWPAMFVWLGHQPHSAPVKYSQPGYAIFTCFLVTIMATPLVWAIDVLLGLPHWPWERP